MIANYHTHTYRCNHAIGTEREYIEAAIESGLKIFGFSDHCPYVFENGFFSDFRMKVSEAEEYANTIRKLAEEYKNDIEIHLGFEVEYYPRHFEKTIKLLKSVGAEYFILGQHHIRNEYDGAYAGFETEDDEIFKTYINQVIEGLKTKEFIYLAHPDLIHYSKNEELYYNEMKKLCIFAKENNVPLEINMLGLHWDRHYPTDRFLKIAAEVQNKVILGLDAHSVEHVLTQKARDRAQEIIKKYNFDVIQKLNLKK